MISDANNINVDLIVRDDIVFDKKGIPFTGEAYDLACREPYGLWGCSSLYWYAEYDRDIYAGLDYLSGTMDCGFPARRDVSVVIANPTFYPNGSVHANASVGPDLQPVNYEYKVDIPSSFYSFENLTDRFAEIT